MSATTPTIARRAGTIGTAIPRRWWWHATDAAAVTWRNLLQYVRIPELLIFSTIQPVMFVLLFAFVFGGAIQVPGGNYVNYLMPGIFVQTAVFGATATGVGLTEDLRRGMIDRFRSLPMSPSAVLAGRTFADLIRNFFVILLMTAVGYLIGFRFEAGLPAAFLALTLVGLFGYAFSWIEAWIGLRAPNAEVAQAAGFIWIFPLTFVSSAFVPVESMPSWLQPIADANPVTVAVNTIRGLVGGGATLGEFLLTLGWIAAILAVFVLLSVRAYRRIQ
jgi:ABC-2 type transport system permease protein/oleandomycin transport system permease protein